MGCEPLIDSSTRRALSAKIISLLRGFFNAFAELLQTGFSMTRSIRHINCSSRRSRISWKRINRAAGEREVRSREILWPETCQQEVRSLFR